MYQIFPVSQKLPFRKSGHKYLRKAALKPVRQTSKHLAAGQLALFQAAHAIADCCQHITLPPAERLLQQKPILIDAPGFSPVCTGRQTKLHSSITPFPVILCFFFFGKIGDMP